MCLCSVIMWFKQGLSFNFFKFAQPRAGDKKPDKKPAQQPAQPAQPGPQSAQPAAHASSSRQSGRDAAQQPVREPVQTLGPTHQKASTTPAEPSQPATPAPEEPYVSAFCPPLRPLPTPGQKADKKADKKADGADKEPLPPQTTYSTNTKQWPPPWLRQMPERNPDIPVGG